ncbi:hypothetical protein ACO22_01847, partial [Paracoccidioides brasiliensis]
HSRFECVNGKLLEIDTTSLQYLYSAQDLVDNLALQIPEKAKASIPKEYLVAR